MTFSFENLDPTTRKLMMLEVDHDISKNELFISPRLTQKGTEEYAKILKEAIMEGNEMTLASKLRTKGLIKAKEPRKTKTFIEVFNCLAEAVFTLEVAFCGKHQVEEHFLYV